MSQFFGTVVGQRLTDKEIAEDILSGQKYMSNYYYAPAVLEANDPQLRSTFQQIYNEAQQEAKEVFDYLNQKGWYRPRPADSQAINELVNTVQQSRQTISAISQAGEISAGGIGQAQQVTWAAGQGNYYGYYQPPGAMRQSELPGWARGGMTQTAQTGQSGMYAGSRQAGTGQYPNTEAGEGQGGYGPSSLAQGYRASAGHQGYGEQYGQYNLPAWAYGAGMGGTAQGTFQAGGFQQQSLSSQARGQAGQGSQGIGGQYPNTIAGEGQGGYGPSSLSYGTRQAQPSIEAQ